MSAVLFLCLFAGQAALISMAPVLAQAAADLDVSVAAAGQLRTIAGLAAGLTALSLARVAGRLGLGRQVLAASALLAVGSAASALAPSFEALALAQVPVGVSVAVLNTAATVAVAEWVAPEHRTRVLSWALVGQPAAWIVGMPLVGFLAEASWRYGWLALPFLASFAAAAAVVGRRREPPLHDEPATARTVLVEPGAARWLVCDLLANAAWAGTLVYAGALLVESHGTSAGVTGLLLAIGATAYVAGNLASQRLVHRPTRSLLAAFGLALSLLGLAFGAVRPDAAVSTALLALAAVVAGGRTLVASAHGLAVPSEQRAAVTALRAATTQFGYFLGSIACGTALAVGGYTAFGAVVGALFLGSALVVAPRPVVSRAAAALSRSAAPTQLPAVYRARG